MPEIPDLAVYLEHLERRTVGATLERSGVRGLNLLRTAEPPLETAHGRRVSGLRRVGKRLVFALEGDLFLVIHLMIAGRLHWYAPPRLPPARAALATFGFSTGALTLTEAGTKQRASLHVVAGEAALATLDPGGIEPLEASASEFAARLRREDHTLKRALTDPRLFAGIGNSYSDEILHRARLSPLRRTPQLSDDEVARLHQATHATLVLWIARLRADAGEAFPERVTAFRKGMAVHGRYREPCPDCGALV